MKNELPQMGFEYMGQCIGQMYALDSNMYSMMWGLVSSC